MRILLISPSSGNWKGIAKKKIFNGKTFRFSMLSLLTVAALTPKEHEVTILDEQFEDLPLDKNFDLVGITAMTAVVPRAYEIANIYKNLGIPVIMGGYHATLNTKEVLKYADSVVAGVAYKAWEHLLDDFQKGDIKRIYYGEADNNIPIHLPREKLSKRNYLTINATFATLGCKNLCHFCSINKFYNMNRFHRKISDVIQEIKAFKDNFFIFVDDNLIQDRDYASILFKSLIPLKKKWVTQVSIDICNDEELLKLISDAGCIGFFIGLETFNINALNSQEKNINLPYKYKEAIKKIHKYKIFVESGIIFGFDTDDSSVFEETLKMLYKIKIDLIQLSILTPLPGTELYENMKDRIIDRNWNHYDYRHVVFKPKQISKEELQNGADWVIRKFYSPLKILSRLLRWIKIQKGLNKAIYPLCLSIAYYGRVKRFKIKGFNPGIKTIFNIEFIKKIFKNFGLKKKKLIAEI